MIKQLYDRVARRYQNGGIDALITAFFSTLRMIFEYGRSSLCTRIPCIEKSIKVYVRFGHLVFPNRYTDADPLKIVWVDPNSITHCSSLGWPVRVGRVYNGNWDINVSSLYDRPIPHGLRQYFHYNINLEKTELYDTFVRKTETHNPWGYSTPAQFDQRRQDIENLYEQIKKEGYRRASDLPDDGNDIHPILDDEIRVDISRDGNLLWRDCGQHRLVIAQQLNIDKVPVHIVARHTEWQSYRNNLRSGATKEHEIPNHPDLTDLRDP